MFVINRRVFPFVWDIKKNIILKIENLLVPLHKRYSIFANFFFISDLLINCVRNFNNRKTGNSDSNSPMKSETGFGSLKFS